VIRGAAFLHDGVGDGSVGGRVSGGCILLKSGV
jgi:hypothetical protein